MDSSAITVSAKIVFNQTGSVALHQEDEITFSVRCPYYLYSQNYSCVLFYVMVDQPEVVLARNQEIKVTINRSGAPSGKVELATIGYQLDENGFFVNDYTNMETQSSAVSQVFHLRYAGPESDSQKMFTLKGGQTLVSLIASPSQDDPYRKCQTALENQNICVRGKKRFDL